MDKNTYMEKPPELPCAMGILEIKGTEVPVYMIDFGEENPPLTNRLEKNECFSIGFRREGEMFVYCVHGDKTSENSDLEFFTSFKVNTYAHEKFQKALGNSSSWFLIVKTSVSSRLLIEKESGKLKKISESLR